MAYQPINLGSAPDDGTGDPPRTAGTKINSNFSELYSAVVNINAETAVIDGVGDQIQLRVQGHSTQTADIFVVENSAGTDLFSVDNSGNVVVAGTVDGRDLATDGSKLDGIEAGADVTDATNVTAALADVPTFKLGNDLSGDRATYIDFQSDDINSRSARAIRTSGENGNLNFENWGTGVINLINNGVSSLVVSSSNIFANKRLVVDGSSNNIQLLVQANATQTADIFVVENSAGTDLLTVDNSGNLDVAGTGTFGGSATSGNALYLQSGDAGTIPAESTQIRFGYNNTDTYTHSIRTRHNSNSPQYNAIDFYLWKQGTDAAGDLGTHRALTLDLVSSTLFGGLLIDGHSDDFQLRVQGHSTQTSDIFVVENSAGTDLLTVDNSGRLTISDGMDHGLVWKDLLGFPIARTLGATDPAFTAFRGGACDAYAFGAGEEVMFYFHIPHDYASAANSGTGSNTHLYLHIHWAHNGTAISGTMQWDYAITYAKGHNQAAFPAETTGSISYSTVNIATTPQYQHRIDEVQITASTPGAGQIDSDDIEVDGLLMVNISANTIPTITGGSPNEPFLFMVDLHYQAATVGTANKAPNFYT